MSGRGTFVLLLLVIVLGGWFWFYEIRGAEDRRRAADEAGRLFAFDSSEVARIRVMKGGDTLVVEREGGTWRVRSPVEAPADPEAVANVLASLLEGRRQEELEPEPGETMTAFGLDPPHMMVELAGSEAPQGAQRILLGDFNPTSSLVYARYPDSSRVLLVGGSVRRVFDGDLEFFRDHALARFQRDDVSLLRVTRAGRSGPLVLERNVEGNWWITEPVSRRADGTKVEQLLRQLGSSRVERFIEEQPVSLAKYGLEEPAVTLEVGFSDGRDEVLVRFGKDAPDGEGIYATWSSGPVFTLFDRSLQALLARDAEDLRARTLIDFEEGEVYEIAVRMGEEGWTARRGKVDGSQPPLSASVWTSAEDGEVFDTAAVSRLLWDLSRLTWERVVRETPDDPALYGLVPAEREYALRDGDGRDLGTLRVGASWAGESGDSLRYVMNASEKTLYAVTEEDLARLPLGPADLRSDQGSTSSAR